MCGIPFPAGYVGCVRELQLAMPQHFPKFSHCAAGDTGLRNPPIAILLPHWPSRANALDHDISSLLVHARRSILASAAPIVICSITPISSFNGDFCCRWAAFSSPCTSSMKRSLSFRLHLISPPCFGIIFLTACGRYVASHMKRHLGKSQVLCRTLCF